MNSNTPPAPEQLSSRVWRFAECEFDELRGELRVRGSLVELEAKPLEVLRQLLLRPGEVVTKEALLDSVWPGVMVVDGSLATAISKLRKGLGDEEEIVVTVPRVGYRLAVPVECTSARDRTAKPEILPAASPPTKEVPSQPRSRRGAIVLLGLLVVLAFAFWIYRGGPAKQNVGAARISSLAVLPLANMSGDPAQDYFADGMTEQLITDLSKIRALKVISRTSVMQYKGVKKPLPQIARELNVDGILEGAVVRSGNRVRVTAQLIRAATDEHVWAESYERDLQDVLSLQRELALQISREIKINVQPSEAKQLTRPRTVNPQAHELYLRGRFFWNRRPREDLFKAANYFQEATRIDSSYAEAYAGLADAYNELVGFGNLPPTVGLPKAKKAALKAIELDESLGEAHAALAYGSGADWDWPEAQKQFQRAVELNPGYAVALYQYGFIVSMWGHRDEAVALTQKALELDPLSQIALYRAGRVYFHAREYENAARQFVRILELNPNDPLGHYGLGLVYEAQGKSDEAILHFQKQKLQQGFELASAYAATGRKTDARRMLEAEMRRLTQEKAYVRPGWVAEVYVSLGENDEAMRWLERAYVEHDSWLALIKVWPAFDRLRSDRRFQDLLQRMNFPQ